MYDKDEKDIIYLKANIKGQILEKFLDLKEHYGVSANAEVVRILIIEKYREIFGEP